MNLRGIRLSKAQLDLITKEIKDSERENFKSSGKLLFEEGLVVALIGTLEFFFCPAAWVPGIVGVTGAGGAVPMSMETKNCINAFIKLMSNLTEDEMLVVISNSKIKEFQQIYETTGRNNASILNIIEKIEIMLDTLKTYKGPQNESRRKPLIDNLVILLNIPTITIANTIASQWSSQNPGQTMDSYDVEDMYNDFVSRTDKLIAQFDPDTKIELRAFINSIITQILPNSESSIRGRVKSMYLQSPPGIGKTHFVDELARTLDIPVCHFDPIKLNGDAITGQQVPTPDGILNKAGEILGTLVSMTKNPKGCKDMIILIDGIDECFARPNQNTSDIIHMLLRLCDASKTRFNNKGCEIEFDITNLIVIGIGNKELFGAHIEPETRAALSSRISVIKIPDLTLEYKCNILREHSHNLVFGNKEISVPKKLIVEKLTNAQINTLLRPEETGVREAIARLKGSHEKFLTASQPGSIPLSRKITNCLPMITNPTPSVKEEASEKLAKFIQNCNYSAWNPSGLYYSQSAKLEMLKELSHAFSSLLYLIKNKELDLALTTIMQMCEDKDPVIRKAAVQVLGSIPHKYRSASKIYKLFGDSDFNVRQAAIQTMIHVWTLQINRSHLSVEYFDNIMTTLISSIDNQAISKHARESFTLALGNAVQIFSHKLNVDILARSLDKIFALCNDTNPDIAKAALNAIAKLNPIISTKNFPLNKQISRFLHEQLSKHMGLGGPQVNFFWPTAYFAYPLLKSTQEMTRVLKNEHIRYQRVNLNHPAAPADTEFAQRWNAFKQETKQQWNTLIEKGNYVSWVPSSLSGAEKNTKLSFLEKLSYSLPALIYVLDEQSIVSTITTVKQYCTNSYPEVRKAAVQFLGNFIWSLPNAQHKDCRESIQKIFDDHDVTVRQAAVQAMTNIWTMTALHVVYQDFNLLMKGIVAEVNRAGISQNMRESWILALGDALQIFFRKLGTKEVIKILDEIINLSNDKNPVIKNAARDALTKINPILFDRANVVSEDLISRFLHGKIDIDNVVTISEPKCVYQLYNYDYPEFMKEVQSNHNRLPEPRPRP